MSKTEYKSWHCLYPIYFERSKKLSEGRKVALKYCIERVQLNEILLACKALRLDCFAEPQKMHPKSCFIYGRVKVQFKEDEKTLLDNAKNSEFLIYYSLNYI